MHTDTYHLQLNQFSDPCRHRRLIFDAILCRSSFCHFRFSSEKHYFYAQQIRNKFLNKYTNFIHISFNLIRNLLLLKMKV